MSKEREAFLRTITVCVFTARLMWLTGGLLMNFFFVTNLVVGGIGFGMLCVGAYMDHSVSKIFKEMRETGEDKL
jgi:hypothetical protein